MFCGLALFEYCWSDLKPLREVDEARDSKYPAYRRYDVKNWAKWKFYPGAVTVLPIRYFLSLFSVFFTFFLIKYTQPFNICIEYLLLDIHLVTMISLYPDAELRLSDF
jgi:hypothetical protein